MRSNWAVIAEQIFHPEIKNKDLKKALDKMQETSEHEDGVQKAFTFGEKPPVMFSDGEYSEM